MRVQNFRPISEEIKNLVSIFEIAIDPPLRNAMRSRYIVGCQKSTNGVSMVTPLHLSYTTLSVLLTAHKQMI